MLEERIISSAGDIKVFIESSIHNDFIHELNIRIEKLQDLLYDPEQDYNGRDYDVFRGGMRNLREMKEIFNDLHRAKLDEQTEKTGD